MTEKIKLGSEKLYFYKTGRKVTVRFSKNHNNPNISRAMYCAEWSSQGRKHSFRATAESKETFKQRLIRERLGVRRKK